MTFIRLAREKNFKKKGSLFLTRVFQNHDTKCCLIVLKIKNLKFKNNNSKNLKMTMIDVVNKC